MIIGTGIDLVELHRIERLMNKNNKFIDRILTEKEKERFNQLNHFKRKVEYVAGRFAAKEAFSKAVGTGIGSDVSFHSVEILSDQLGRPRVYENRTLNEKAHITLSHSKDYAIAQVIIEK